MSALNNNSNSGADDAEMAVAPQAAYTCSGTSSLNFAVDLSAIDDIMDEDGPGPNTNPSANNPNES